MPSRPRPPRRLTRPDGVARATHLHSSLGVLFILAGALVGGFAASGHAPTWAGGRTAQITAVIAIAAGGVLLAVFAMGHAGHDDPRQRLLVSARRARERNECLGALRLQQR